MKQLGWVLAAVVMAGCALDKVEDRACDGQDPVEQALAPYVEKGKLPGAISYLYNDGKVLCTCAGYADIEAKRPISMDDHFMQCSQTKGFCGVTIAKLVEEGKISLDDPVSKYLPEFRTLWVETKNADGTLTHRKAKNALTIRMCLNHTGGFKFELPDYCSMGGWSRRMPLRSVAVMAANFAIQFEPGTKASYSNVGIDIGAAVVEQVTGMRWEDYLKKEVLDPLGMTESTFWPTEKQLAGRIKLYRFYQIGKDKEQHFTAGEEADMMPPFGDDRVFSSAGAGLWTTANDQLKFYKMLMNLGVGDNGVRILKEETVKSILAVSTRPEGLGGYSLGLNAPVAKDDGENAWFGHGGAWGTNCSVNWRKRQLKLWVVQQSNCWCPWTKDYDAAVGKFFAGGKQIDGVRDYTGRMK